MDVVILTGASRGLGAALAERLISPQRRLICVSRKPNDALAEKARVAGAWLDWYLQDLADVPGSDALASAICADLPRDAERYILINNAGIVEPVAQTADLPAHELVTALNVNVAAPMVFTARFLKATAGLQAKKQIVNISSGAARNPVEGWGAYCTTKAALDMFSRAVKLEETPKPHGAKVVSLAPGVIDTDMQGTVRSLDKAAFPQVQRFLDLKANAQLVSPADCAKRILAFLDRADFGEREIDDLRNYLSAT